MIPCCICINERSVSNKFGQRMDSKRMWVGLVSRKGKQSFIQGAMILMVAGIINRLLGFVPRIALPRVMGAEGIGLYQLGYPFLILVITIITGGIPVAVSKLTAEAESEGREDRIKSVLRLSMTITVSLSIVFTVLCLLLSKWITTRLLTDDRAFYTFICMTPMIPLIAVSSVLRGYFEGRQNMIPTASSQIAETIVRIIVAVSLAYILMPYGVEIAAAGAMTGVSLGEFSGMLVLFLQYRIFRKNQNIASLTQIQPAVTQAPLDRLDVIKRLVRFSLPVTGSKLVGSASYFLESVLIVQSLAIAGIASTVATAQYGALQGMVIPILLMPNALTYSLSVSLIPSLSEAAAKKDYRTINKRLHQSLRLALISGAPFASLMFVLSTPLCFYLFHNGEVGHYLKMMAPVALFIYFQGPLQAALQALDRPGTALINTLIGSILKLSCIYLLASRPELGIKGAIIASIINIVVVTLLHWNSVTRIVHFSMKGTEFIKVTASMMLMGASMWLIMYSMWSPLDWLRFLSACFGGFSVYALCLFFFKMVDREDLKRIPWIGTLWSR